MWANHISPNAGTVGKFILCTAVVGAVLFITVFPILPRSPYRVPYWVVVGVKERIPLLRPGMSEYEVWDTLGLSGRGFKAQIGGSGPSNSFPAYYRLWPGYALHARWNLRTRPATLVKAEFRERL